MTGPTYDEIQDCPIGHLLDLKSDAFIATLWSHILPAIKAATDVGRAALAGRLPQNEEILFAMTAFLTEAESAMTALAEPSVTGCQCSTDSSLGLRHEILNMIWPVPVFVDTPKMRGDLTPAEFEEALADGDAECQEVEYGRPLAELLQRPNLSVVKR